MNTLIRTRRKYVTANQNTPSAPLTTFAKIVAPPRKRSSSSTRYSLAIDLLDRAPEDLEERGDEPGHQAVRDLAPAAHGAVDGDLLRHPPAPRVDEGTGDVTNVLATSA